MQIAAFEQEGFQARNQVFTCEAQLQQFCRVRLMKELHETHVVPMLVCIPNKRATHRTNCLHYLNAITQQALV